jgi:hypothetical protein
MSNLQDQSHDFESRARDSFARQLVELSALLH